MKKSDVVAMAIGGLLNQNYRKIDGAWWLFNGDTPRRELRQDEIEWHVLRNHSPFIADGMEKDDPRWYDDPLTTNPQPTF